MKRYVSVALSIIVLCLLSLSTTLVNAYVTGYQNTDFLALSTPTEDGRWTTTAEWNDAAIPPLLPAAVHWREKWTFPSDIIQHVLVEFLTDNTNDAGDYFQLFYDRNADGGTAPQADDIKIEVTGHNSTGVKVYKGNGVGWTLFTGWTWSTDLFVSESLSSSPTSGNTHWILELRLDKSKSDFDISGSGYQPWIGLAMYDASNSAAGVRSWPPNAQNVPNNWGLEIGTMDNIPEGLTILPVVLLSSVAVAVGFYSLRKRPNLKITAA